MGKGGFVYADSDHRASGRTISKRRAADIDFLARVMELRSAKDVRGLSAMLRDHVGAPAWKQIAIRRALKTAIMASPGSTT